MADSLMLGLGVDLSRGVRSAWSFADPTSSTPFFTARQNPIQTEPAEGGSGRGAWRVQITLHDSPEALAGALQPISITTSFRELDQQDVPPGGIMRVELPLGSMTLCDADRQNALKRLSDWLGLKVGTEAETGAAGYALVRWLRDDAVIGHPKFNDDGWISKDDAASVLTEAARRRLAGFRPGGIASTDPAAERRPTPAHARNILESFADIGTHVITKITFGDEILQVFSYGAEAWKEVRGEYGVTTLHGGSAARSFRYFVQKRTPDGIGYVHEGGRPRARSGDAALDSALAAKRLDDGAPYQSILILAGDPDLQKSLTTRAPIAFHLIPVTDLLVASVSPISRPAAELARDLLMARIYLSCGDATGLSFKARYCGAIPQLQGLGGLNLLSNIATRQTDLFLPSLTLKEMDVVNPEAVQTLNMLGLTIELAGREASLCGQRISLAGYVLSGPRDRKTGVITPGTIIVPDAAFDSIRMSFGAVEGIVAIASKDGSKRQLLVDGLVLRRGNVDTGTGRWAIHVTDQRTDLLDASLFADFENLIELSLVTAETLLRVPARNTDQRGKELAAAYLRWMASVLADGSIGSSANPLAARIAYLGNTVVAHPEADDVPPFAYDAYKDAAGNILKYAERLEGSLFALKQQMLSERREAQAARNQRELVGALSRQATKLNDFIAQTGDFHRQVATSLDQLIEHDKATLAQQLGSVEALRVAYLNEANLTKVAVGKFIEKNIDEVWKRIALTVFDGLSALFAVGKAIAAEGEGAGDAVKSIINFAKSVKDLVDFADKLRTVASKVSKAGGSTSLLTDVQSLLISGMDSAAVVVPSRADWKNLMVDISAALRDMPEGKEIIEDAYLKMVNTGSAWVDAQIAAHATAREVYANTLRRDIEARQGGKLTALAQLAAAPPATGGVEGAAVDLVSIGGVLQARLAQAQAWLSRVLLLQEQALVYEYFKQPLALESFDLTALLATVAQQSQTIIDEAAAHPTEGNLHAIKYPILIPLDALIGAADGGTTAAWSHRLPIDSSKFMDYAHVRIRSYDVTIDRVEVKPPTGEAAADQVYFLEIGYDGDLLDRDWQGDTKQFRGMPTGRIIEITAASGANSQPSLGGPPPIMVTPFSTWSIRLDTSVCELQKRGIAFVEHQDHPGYVQLTFTFHVQAARNPKRPRLVRGTGVAATQAVDGSLREFFAHMASEKQSALLGWDVVFSMREEKVNAILASQWADWQKSHNGSLPPLGTITTEWDDEFDGKRQLTITNLQLGQPKLRFSEVFGGDAWAILDMALEGGKWQLRAGDRARSGTIDGGGLTISVPLSLVHGTVDADGKETRRNIAAVALNFEASKADVVTINGLQLDPAAKEDMKSKIRTSIVEYFQTHAFAYRIQALDLSGHGGLIPALTPHDFFLRTVILDDSHKFLQLYINTNARSASGGDPAYRNGKDDLHLATPVPVPDGFDCALMVNSMILFRDVLQGGLHGIGLAAAPVKANDYSDQSRGLWSASVNGWNIDGGSFDLGNSEVKIGPVRGRVAIGASLAGTSIAPKTERSPLGAASFAKLAFNMPEKMWNLPFEQREEIIFTTPTPKGPIFNHTGQYEWKTRDYVVASLSLAFEAPLAIAGKGEAQAISLSLPVDLGPNNWNVDARLPASCPSPQDKLRQQIANTMNANLPGALSASIKGASFAPVSVFALQNLLFPSGNHITLSQVHVPGDLVILGHIDTGQT